MRVFHRKLEGDVSSRENASISLMFVMQLRCVMCSDSKMHTKTNQKKKNSVVLLCSEKANHLSCVSYGRRGFSLFKVIPIHKHPGNPRQEINASPFS